MEVLSVVYLPLVDEPRDDKAHLFLPESQDAQTCMCLTGPWAVLWPAITPREIHPNCGPWSRWAVAASVTLQSSVPKFSLTHSHMSVSQTHSHISLNLQLNWVLNILLMKYMQRTVVKFFWHL
jgi:hypothetical protein